MPYDGEDDDVSSQPKQIPSLQETAAKLTQAIGSYEWRGDNSPDTYKKVNQLGAMGRYQFMPATLKQDSKRYLGREVSPEEFLANPGLQDHLAQLKTYYTLADNYTKYGDLTQAEAMTAIDHYGHNGGRLNARAMHNGRDVGESPNEYAANVLAGMGENYSQDMNTIGSTPISAYAQPGIFAVTSLEELRAGKIKNPQVTYTAPSTPDTTKQPEPELSPYTENYVKNLKAKPENPAPVMSQLLGLNDTVSSLQSMGILPVNMLQEGMLKPGSRKEILSPAEQLAQHMGDPSSDISKEYQDKAAYDMLLARPELTDINQARALVKDKSANDIIKSQSETPAQAHERESASQNSILSAVGNLPGGGGLLAKIASQSGIIGEAGKTLASTGIEAVNVFNVLSGTHPKEFEALKQAFKPQSGIGQEASSFAGGGAKFASEAALLAAAAPELVASAPSLMTAITLLGGAPEFIDKLTKGDTQGAAESAANTIKQVPESVAAGLLFENMMPATALQAGPSRIKQIIEQAKTGTEIGAAQSMIGSLVSGQNLSPEELARQSATMGVYGALGGLETNIKEPAPVPEIAPEPPPPEPEPIPEPAPEPVITPEPIKQEAAPLPPDIEESLPVKKWTDEHGVPHEERGSNAAESINIPFEVATENGTDIYKQAITEHGIEKVTRHVYSELPQELQRLAEESGADIEIINSSSRSGGYTPLGADKGIVTPNINIEVRGDAAHAAELTKAIRESARQESARQESAMLLRPQTLDEIHAGETNAKPALVITLPEGTTDEKAAKLYNKLNAIRDLEDQPVYTGYTLAGNDMIIGSAFYGGDFGFETNRNSKLIRKAIRQANIDTDKSSARTKYELRNVVQETYYDETASANDNGRDQQNPAQRTGSAGGLGVGIREKIKGGLDVYFDRKLLELTERRSVLPEPRTQEAEVSPLAGTPHTERQAGSYITSEPLTEHVITRGERKGQAIQGVIATDLTRTQARKIDPYAFKKGDGWFISSEHISQGEPKLIAEPKKRSAAPLEVKPINDLTYKELKQRAISVGVENPDAYTASQLVTKINKFPKVEAVSERDGVPESPIYYHATTKEHADSIRELGFKSRIGERSENAMVSGEGVFFYPNKEAAKEFQRNFTDPSEIISSSVHGKIYDATKEKTYGFEDNLQITEIANRPQIIQALRADGYSGVLSTELGEPVAFIFDPEKIKIKRLEAVREHEASSSQDDNEIKIQQLNTLAKYDTPGNTFAKGEHVYKYINSASEIPTTGVIGEHPYIKAVDRLSRQFNEAPLGERRKIAEKLEVAQNKLEQHLLVGGNELVVWETKHKGRRLSITGKTYEDFHNFVRVGEPHPMTKTMIPGAMPGQEYQGNIQPSEIIQLAKDLGVKIEAGKMGKARGMFISDEEGNTAIKLDPRIFVDPIGAAKTIAHEFGHFIDYAGESQTTSRGTMIGHLKVLYASKERFLDKISESSIRQQMIELSQLWKPYDQVLGADKKYVAYRNSNKELFADTMSAMLNNPLAVAQVAPDFYAHFTKMMDEKPGVKTAFYELQKKLIGSPDQMYLERQQRNIKAYAEARNITMAQDLDKYERDHPGFKETVRKKAREFRVAFTDTFYNIKKYDKHGLTPGIGESASNYIEELAFKNKNAMLNHDLYINVEQKLGAHNITPDEFGDYMQLLAESGMRKGMLNPGGATGSEAALKLYQTKQAVGEVKAKALQDAADYVHDELFKIVTDGYESGLYTDNFYHDVIVKNKDSYATFTPVEHSKTWVSAKMIEAVGTMKEIGNPYDKTVQKMFALNRLVQVQKAKQKTVESLLAHAPEGEILPYDLHPKDGVPAPYDTDRYGVLRLMDKGQEIGFLTDPHIAESLQGASTMQLDLISKFFAQSTSKISRPLMTTYAITFALWNNPIRDIKRTRKAIPDPAYSVPIVGWMKSLWDFTKAMPEAYAYAHNKESDLANELIRNNAIESYGEGYFFHDTKDPAREFLERRGHVKLPDTEWSQFKSEVKNAKPYDIEMQVLKGVSKVLGFARSIGETIEISSKLSGYKKLQEMRDKGEINLSDRDIAYYVRSYIGTPNYRVKGQYSPFSNSFFMFSNIFVQGLRSDIDVIRNPTTQSGYLWKTLSGNVLPKIFQWTLASGAMTAIAQSIFGDDSKEAKAAKEMHDMYSQISEYDLLNYTCIPLGWSKDKDGNAVVNFYRIPIDETGRFISGLTWQTLDLGAKNKELNPQDMLEIFDYAAGQLPSLSPVIKNISETMQFATGNNPYDFFRNRNIFDDATWNSSDFSKKAGVMLNRIFIQNTGIGSLHPGKLVKQSNPAYSRDEELTRRAITRANADQILENRSALDKAKEEKNTAPIVSALSRGEISRRQALQDIMKYQEPPGQARYDQMSLPDLWQLRNKVSPMNKPSIDAAIARKAATFKSDRYSLQQVARMLAPK